MSKALAICFVLQAALPQSSLFARQTLRFSLPYFSLLMSLNIALTLLLAIRLFYIRWQIVKVLGEEYGRMYTGVATMVLESGLPYGIISLIFVILYGINNNGAILFIPLISQLEVSSCLK
jgi:hypothetical protein